ncbi:sulfatase-like hydrolase/transferase [Fulvivirga sp. M361]|uniref:sulfatase-like hydrolase/transferase n=1 Tax=Fulvivirga sp. M361 TaxID=2594266 RepID=UPI001179F312|nr:sulfatase-like hydrolase/transferase [Fulvivirga sp. M361]TRX59225.1 sulfatase-like hydrolase/transferase [Fulvivirga sp. M361]
MMKICLSVSLLLFVGSFGYAQTNSEASQKPNIVIIYTDDQGYGDVAALNPEAKFKTPNMDQIVNEGATFTDGHSSDAVCTPSRYSLLTGRYSWRTSLKKGVLRADGPCLIEKGRTTIASLLRENGYNTAMVGKWKLNMLRGSGGSLQPTFIEPQAGEAPFELYNLEDDPGETTNLYFQHPGIVDRLKVRITEIVENGRSTPGVPQGFVKENWNQLTWMKF